MDLKHAKLSDIAEAKVQGSATYAADKSHAGGGSPRAQLEAARESSGNRLVYLPHQGMKERLKRIKRMEKAAK